MSFARCKAHREKNAGLKKALRFSPGKGILYWEAGGFCPKSNIKGGKTGGDKRPKYQRGKRPPFVQGMARRQPRLLFRDGSGALPPFALIQPA